MDSSGLSSFYVFFRKNLFEPEASTSLDKDSWSLRVQGWRSTVELRARDKKKIQKR